MGSFRTKRLKLEVCGAEDCSFNLIVVEDPEALDRYVESLTGVRNDGELGAACCLCHDKKREVNICLSASIVSNFIIGHEAFHAALYYARLNRRRYTVSKWVYMLKTWTWLNLQEEELASVCGALVQLIGDRLNEKYRFCTNPGDSHNG